MNTCIPTKTSVKNSAGITYFYKHLQILCKTSSTQIWLGDALQWFPQAREEDPFWLPGKSKLFLSKTLSLHHEDTPLITQLVSKEEKQMWNFAWCEKRAPGHSSQSKLAPTKGGEWGRWEVISWYLLISWWISCRLTLTICYTAGSLCTHSLSIILIPLFSF